MASEIDPSDFRGISMIGDGINHAVPTHWRTANLCFLVDKKGLGTKALKLICVDRKGVKQFENVSHKHMVI